MAEWRRKVPVRGVVWLLFLLCTFLGAFFSGRCLMSLPVLELSTIGDTTAFYYRLQSRQDTLVDYIRSQLMQQNPDLSYLERQQHQTRVERIHQSLLPENTNFRFSIHSWDGSQLLLSNLEEMEPISSLVPNVQYGSIRLQEGGLVEEIHRLDAPPEIGASREMDTSHLLTDSPEVESTALAQALQGEGVVVACGVLPDEKLTAQDEFLELYHSLDRAKRYFLPRAILALVFLGVGGLLLVGLLWSAGVRPGREEIVQSWQERTFTEAWLFVMWLATTLVEGIWWGWADTVWYVVEYMDESLMGIVPLLGAVVVTLWMLLAALTLQTVSVRLKRRELIHSTLVLRMVWVMGRALRQFFRTLPFVWKTVLAFLGYLLVIFLVDSTPSLVYYAPLPGMAVNLVALVLLCRWAYGFWVVRKGTEEISAGHLSHRLDTAHLPGELKRHAEALNNLSAGLTTAVNEQMKSERFKAELITNVSHDLKTPLTSIINYVNLLKTTRQEDPTALEYIQVLERKSNRLKKLTEDLVEASKASSGMLPVNREKIGMAQLLDQALGEYEEKLEARQLTVVRSVPEGECFVYADGRHLWRVIDNLLGNCAKYALEGTRIYIDLEKGQGTVTLSVKNVSRDPLNVPPERLLERFVRGDASRTTEGSGLGLSIARSLTELQGGTFQLAVDGDLFKALVSMPQCC